MSVTLSSEFLRTSISEIEAKTKSLELYRTRLAEAICDGNLAPNAGNLSKFEINRLIKAVDTSKLSQQQAERVSKRIESFSRRVVSKKFGDFSASLSFLGNELHSFDDEPAVKMSNGVAAWCYKGKLYREVGPCYIDYEGRVITSSSSKDDVYNCYVNVADFVLHCHSVSSLGNVGPIMKTISKPAKFDSSSTDQFKIVDVKKLDTPEPVKSEKNSSAYPGHKQGTKPEKTQEDLVRSFLGLDQTTDESVMNLLASFGAVPFPQ